MRSEQTQHTAGGGENPSGFVLMLSLVLLLASAGSAATSGAIALERTCVARISGPVVAALRERCVVEARDPVVLLEPQVVETVRVVAVCDGPEVCGDVVTRRWWTLDLPPPVAA